jgi:Predicted membrane protein
MIGSTINIILNPVPEKFTEFYILGPTGKAYDYPTNLKLGETGEVIIGVINHEYQTTNYRIIVKIGENIIDNITITLKNGEKWEKRFKFTPTEVGDNQKLQFLLYRLPDEKRVYRSLNLSINVKE